MAAKYYYIAASPLCDIFWLENWESGLSFAWRHLLITNIYTFQNLTDHINERNRAAQIAQRESQILFQTLYFKVS